MNESSAIQTGADQGFVTRSFGIIERSINEGRRSADFVASTEVVDHYGEVVEQTWDFTAFDGNPVALYAHDSTDFPIGLVTRREVVQGPSGPQLECTIQFSTEDLNPKAEQVWRNVKARVLRAVSVGFRPRSVRYEKRNDRDVYVLSNNLLLEISVTPIGANYQALAKMKSAAKAAAFESATTGDPARDAAFARAKAEAEAANIDTTDAGQEPDMNVKTILALLSLNETATEAEVVDKVKALEKRVADADARVESAVSREKAAAAQVSELLAEAGVDNVEKAKGAIAAGKAAVAELADAKAKNEALERTQLIADAKAAKKLTPAQEEGLKGKSIDFVKSFIELQHPNPTLAKTEEEQPQVNSSALTFEGKSWNDLSPSEKHNLFHTNKDLYVAMRDAA